MSQTTQQIILKLHTKVVAHTSLQVLPTLRAVSRMEVNFHVAHPPATRGNTSVETRRYESSFLESSDKARTCSAQTQKTWW